MYIDYVILGLAPVLQNMANIIKHKNQDSININGNTPYKSDPKQKGEIKNLKSCEDIKTASK